MTRVLWIKHMHRALFRCMKECIIVYISRIIGGRLGYGEQYVVNLVITSKHSHFKCVIVLYTCREIMPRHEPAEPYMSDYVINDSRHGDKLMPLCWIL